MNKFSETKLLSEEQKNLFVQKLEKGLDLRNEDGKTIWNCDEQYSISIQALHEIGLKKEQIKETLMFFQENGGYCDCEIMLNVICGD